MQMEFTKKSEFEENIKNQLEQMNIKMHNEYN